MISLRSQARALFHEALYAVQLPSVLHHKLRAEGRHLCFAGDRLDLTPFHQVFVLALGKAALPMAASTLEALSPLLGPTQTLRGIVVGRSLPPEPDPRIAYLLGAHPLPTAGSGDAARRILALLHTADEHTLVLFLLSGGASAMVEQPLHPSITLPDLIAFHQVLVHAGLPIAAMNTLRKHISAVKGGRLALAAAPATQVTLLVSDVPPAHPEVIASGPTLPDPTTLQDCRDLLRTALAGAAVPRSVRTLLLDPATPDTPKPGDPAFSRTRAHTLLSSDDLALAAQQAAVARGFHTVLDQTPDDWPYSRAATFLLDRLHSVAAAHPTMPICLVSTGELSVPVTTPTPGTGGRNSHFALHCALSLAGFPRPAAVLSAGSDGIDGVSPAAGAVVDDTTIARAQALHLDPAAALAAFNTYPLLHAIGDTLVTGPTGNNLRDLRLLLTPRLSCPRR